MNGRKTIGVLGIGSTNLYSGLGDPVAGTLRAVERQPTRAHDLDSQAVEIVDRLIEENGDLETVCIACAGLVSDTEIRKFDTPDGEIIERVPIGDSIEKTHGIDVCLENDCTASTLAEWFYGAGREYDSIVHLTFGTGIGCGVVERGRLLRGETDQAGEVGLLPVVSDGDLESAGVTGAWEAYCSGRGIPNYAAQLLGQEDETDLDQPTTAKAVFEAAANGDTVAQNALEQVGKYNAAGLGAVANAYNPGLITVGGGVALNNCEWFQESVLPHFEEYCFVDQPAIEMTTLEDQIGLYGALAIGRNADKNAVRGTESEVVKQVQD
ncbi:ROK family protein [Halovenus marina]|uniref:ROK family protein n=1 Tax=Halovenus marina TaxID=3396621 RepID=UPI003F5710AB